MTPAEAIANACRLLQAAEVDTNLAMMERLDEMAMTWVHIAEFLTEHTDAQQD